MNYLIRFYVSFIPFPSDSQIGTLDVWITKEILPRSLHDDAAVPQHITSVSKPQGLDHVLGHQKYRDSLVVQGANDLENLCGDLRRKAKRGLIEHHEPGPCHERPCAGQHLLFPATERSCELTSPLGKDRKEFKDTPQGYLKMASCLWQLGPHLEITEDLQPGKELPSLWDLDDPPLAYLVGWDPMDRFSQKED